jgi:hypothetical protein
VIINKADGTKIDYRVEKKEFINFLLRELNDKSNENKTIKEIEGSADLKVWKAKDIIYRIKEEKYNLYKKINTSKQVNDLRNNYEFPIFDEINKELEKYNIRVQESEEVYIPQAIQMNYEMHFLNKKGMN